MEPICIIKKYSNRRLYNTSTSQYTSLDEIKTLVLNQIPFKVIEATTDEDVTAYVLMQIINDAEASDSPLFNIDTLRNMIRFYGNPLQKKMSQFLENCFSTILEPEVDFDNYFKN